jgi:RimJ/RimL family protein N-acetyltransferase
MKNFLIKIKSIDIESEAIVQKIFEASPTYFRRVDGMEVEPHFAKREITDCPPKRIASYEKVFCLILFNNEPIGVVDFHKDHPAEGITYVGLFLLDEKYHGKGIGRSSYAAAEEFAKSNLKAKSIRLGVSDKNAVTDFWCKMGFKPTGHTYIWKGEKAESNVTEMEKQIIKN